MYNNYICKNCNSSNCHYDKDYNFTICQNNLCLKGHKGYWSNQYKWDLHWLNLAKFTSQCSKDPSTKTGAVIISTNNTVVSTGYNGLPIGVEDNIERYNNRELKYKMVCHCEMNSILFAKKDITNHILYTYPFSSCSNCAKYIIQTGIKRCVAPILPKELEERWKEDTDLANLMFKEANIELTLLDYK